MKLSRFVRGLKSARRIGEIARCYHLFCPLQRMSLATSFLGFTTLTYPMIVRFCDGGSIKLWSWHDLTTLWVVWCSSAYGLHPEDRKIVDLGANIGAFTLLAARNARCVVIAVEPFPQNCSRLRENVARLPQSDNVVILEAAVDWQRRSLWMSADTSIPSHSHQVSQAPPEGSAVEVSTVTLSELIDQAGGAIDFLKVDIEGYEYELFEGSTPEMLSAILRICVEYHGRGGWRRLCPPLERAGFRLIRHWSEGIRGTLEFARMAGTRE